MFHGRISLKYVLLVLLGNFLSGLRLELMYISLIEMYQVKPRSSPWFSAACATAVVHRNLFFFFCTNRINLLSIKQSSDRLVIVPKRVLEAAKLAHANKTKESITSQKLGSPDF